MKALREAKRRSSWRHPDTAYEETQLGFLRALLDAGRPNPFLADLAELVARVAPIAAVHSLAQVALKLSAPGLPDTYQGGERWDLSLADPDNRRPVDLVEHEATLAAIEAERARDPAAAEAALLDGWCDGRVKQALTARLLDLRRRHPEPFAAGDYLALEAKGRHAERVVAFARIAASEQVVVVAPRLVAPLLPAGAGLRIPAGAWADTVLRLPDDAPGAWRDALRGSPLAAGPGRGVPVATLLSPLPVAVLVTEPPRTPR